LVLECSVFGIFTTLFVTAIWVLVNKPSTGRTSYLLVLTVCLMYLLAITNLTIDIYRAMHAFSSVHHGSILGHGKLNKPTEIAKTAVFSVQAVLADGLFVWRCYIVWNKNWFIIGLPIIMILGEMASAAGLCWAFWNAQTRHVAFESALAPWITATFSMTLATNVVCTGLIVYRIWRSQRQVEPACKNSTFLPVMVMIIESGAIYSAALISVVVTYSAGHSAQYVLLDFLPSLIGVVFTLIVVRVGLGIGSNGSASSQSQKDHTIPTFSIVTSHEDSSGNYSVKSVSVDGMKHFDVESGYGAGH